MKRNYYGARMTIVLSVILCLIIMVFWSLFISGPSRVHEQIYAQTIAKIEKNVDGIEGITEHMFDYVTYQGYTESTLYWFDESGNEITNRKIGSLDYQEARSVAKETFGITAETVELGYGYDNPVYEIRGKNRMILLDYDTYERIYERKF